MSNRTWACIPCGKTFRRDAALDALNCAECGGACEYVEWKIHIPSPRNGKRWAAFWKQYRYDKSILEAFHKGELVEIVHLKLLNMALYPQPQPHRRR